MLNAKSPIPPEILQIYRRNNLAQSGIKPRILIVEDDPSARRLIKRYLQEDGYDIEVTDRGETAWQIILTNPPNLIISDWCMPDISGLILCQRVKANAEHPELSMIYFILVTAYANMTYRVAGLEAGADEFLAKPLDPSELRARVRAGLRLSLLTQSLLRTNQQLQAQNKLLESLSLTDALTNALNRRALDQALPKLLDDLAQGEIGTVAVLMIDIDHFKQINDNYGHLVGDQILQALVGRLKNNIFANSFIYRYGGEEFVCVTTNITEEEMIILCQGILNTVSHHRFSIGNHLIPVTVSIGASLASTDNLADAPTLLEQADQCLYRAKKAGRNRAVIYQSLGEAQELLSQVYV
ncbi:MAG: diguanylate cyclase [Pseudanabaenaceae cyanobacterium SKYGB_i_bin29]|nr:diguanylate cyclase [Pseudanabaenaceae cyanobacterium SKYG29]MDW8421737.1 diguanylate cyclase [Pseudanabaenaceae cyanobacterium SKYGB_i_bin29]